jgi:large subunit ribosomal protein L10
MKGSLAKAARTFDALRIKLEAGAPAPVAAAVVETPAVVEPAAEVAVSEPEALAEVAEVPAQVETTEEVVATETPAETPAE